MARGSPYDPEGTPAAAVAQAYRHLDHDANRRELPHLGQRFASRSRGPAVYRALTRSAAALAAALAAVVGTFNDKNEKPVDGHRRPEAIQAFYRPDATQSI